MLLPLRAQCLCVGTDVPAKDRSRSAIRELLAHGLNALGSSPIVPLFVHLYHNCVYRQCHQKQPIHDLDHSRNNAMHIHVVITPSATDFCRSKSHGTTFLLPLWLLDQDISSLVVPNLSNLDAPQMRHSFTELTVVVEQPPPPVVLYYRVMRCPSDNGVEDLASVCEWSVWRRTSCVSDEVSVPGRV